MILQPAAPEGFSAVLPRPPCIVRGLAGRRESGLLVSIIAFEGCIISRNPRAAEKKRSSDEGRPRANLFHREAAKVAKISLINNLGVLCVLAVKGFFPHS
jgi:hypothetical protein